MWWTRREFFKGSAAAAAGVYGLLPRFGLAKGAAETLELREEAA